ncbi:MAG: S9 family peptidase [Calditrichaeota bacterium]|nr:MAG: S9 family peptidase [Calditrichota bacterium]
MKIFTLLLLATATLLCGADKKPFDIEALYKMRSVSDVQVSPDGKKVAFVVTRYVLKEGKANSDIWLMNTDGTDLFQLTNSDAADYNPRWHQDGRHLLFISTRENGPQVWMIRATGGEAAQLTEFPTGASAAAWQNDGYKVVFKSFLYPECGADAHCNEALKKDMNEGPLQAHYAQSLFYRHWTVWMDGRRSHLLSYDPDTDSYTDLTPDNYNYPALWGGFDVSPDGRYVAVESNHDTNSWETTNKDVFEIDLKTLKMRNLTADNKGYDGHPHYSPDGTQLAFLRQVTPTFESDLMRLMILNRKTGRAREVATDIANNIKTAAWIHDGGRLIAKVEEKGYYPLYVVNVVSGKSRLLLRHATVDNFALTPDDSRIVFASRAIDNPHEIYTTALNNLKAGAIRKLTGFNDSLRQAYDIRPFEEVWIPSPTGRKIHTFLIKPHNFKSGKKYPAIINVHGGPQGQWSNSFRGDWQIYPGAGYVLAFPNPHGSTGYGQPFTDAISRDWGGKVFQDVMAVTDYISKLPYVDDARMGAMGWSYGGYMMNWLQGHTKRFKAIVSMMGLYNLTSFYGATEELWFPQWDLGGTPWDSEDYLKWSPDQFVKNFSTPTLIITGEKDFRVPYTQSLEYFTALQKRGIPSELIVFKNDGHWPSHIKSMPFYYNAHLYWFHKYLGGDPAPYDMKKMWQNRAF